MFVAVAWIALVTAFLVGRKFEWDSAFRQVIGTGLECSSAEGLEAVKRYLLSRGQEEDSFILDEEKRQIPKGIYSKVIGCADLDQDGTDEMVLLADGHLAGGAHPVSWFILEQDGDRWKTSFARIVPTPEIKVSEGVVTESTPGYLEGDAMGAPSFRRIGRIVPENGSFTYVLEGDLPRNRKISLSRDTMQAAYLGPLWVLVAEPEDAEDAFGRPTFEYSSGEVCSMSWADLGIAIEFANLGGFDACMIGNIQSFSVEGSSAETAGWEGPWGTRIGMKRNEVLRRFPSATLASSSFRPEGVPDDWEAWELERTASAFGYGGTIASVSGYFENDRLRWLEFWVGAAGE